MTPNLDQLMELINKVKGQQTTLDRVASQQVANQPWRQPGETQGALAYATGQNTPAQGRGLNQLYGAILNRQPGQTRIGAATEGFERGSQLIDTIREKEKAGRMDSAKIGLDGAQQDLSNQANMYKLKEAADQQDWREKSGDELMAWRKQRAGEQDALQRELAAGRQAATLEAAKLRQAGKTRKPTDLDVGTPTRHSNIDKAVRFLTAFESGAESGTTRTAMRAIPGVWTDQGKFDQELDSFAESAARAALKAQGEIRPTDADVKGMKEAMFGVGKDEQVNKNLLESYLAEQIALENQWRQEQGLPGFELPPIQGVGKDFYDKLFTRQQDGTQGTTQVVDFNDL